MGTIGQTQISLLPRTAAFQKTRASTPAPVPYSLLSLRPRTGIVAAAMDGHVKTDEFHDAGQVAAL